MSQKKKLFWVVTALVLLFGVVNFNFFWRNLVFTFQGNKDIFKTQQTPLVAANINMEPNWLLVDSLRIKVPIIYVTEKTEKVYQTALKNGVVHFPDSANVGELGNCYIFGHSSDYIWSKGNYKTIFATLPRIKLGAEIVASNSQGQAFTYVVKKSYVTSAKDVSVLAQDKQKRILTLQTSYPVGTALQRWIVIAELKS